MTEQNCLGRVDRRSSAHCNHCIRFEILDAFNAFQNGFVARVGFDFAEHLHCDTGIFQQSDMRINYPELDQLPVSNHHHTFYAKTDDLADQ